MHFVAVPDALDLYEKLGVKHQPLKVISPNFEAPLPPLQAAVSHYCTVVYFIPIKEQQLTSLQFKGLGQLRLR